MSRVFTCPCGELKQLPFEEFMTALKDHKCSAFEPEPKVEYVTVDTQPPEITLPLEAYEGELYEMSGHHKVHVPATITVIRKRFLFSKEQRFKGIWLFNAQGEFKAVVCTPEQHVRNP